MIPFPVKGDSLIDPLSRYGAIPREVAAKAFEKYANINNLTLEQIGSTGGFAYWELDHFIPGEWREHFIPGYEAFKQAENYCRDVVRGNREIEEMLDVIYPAQINESSSVVSRVKELSEFIKTVMTRLGASGLS
jgi:hypothetical protein